MISHPCLLQQAAGRDGSKMHKYTDGRIGPLNIIMNHLGSQCIHPPRVRGEHRARHCHGMAVLCSSRTLMTHSHLTLVLSVSHTTEEVPTSAPESSLIESCSRFGKIYPMKA
ncbi:unnamed protein product, partial [Meganyctiphanes norvegica]